MATASTFARDRGGRAGELLAVVSAQPLWVAWAIVAIVIAVRAAGTVDADVGWQLWIAHQLNGGVRLYRDINEANPPLWFWMAMPVDRLSTLIHVRSDRVLIVVLGCFSAFSLSATNRLLEPIEARLRTLLLAYAALVLVAMPWLQFGQREQIALIGSLPYAALIAARRTGRRVSTSFALPIGAGAGLGFALKHYFLLVPLLLELWLLAGQRRKWRPLRAESLAIAAIGTLYLAAFALFARDYLSVELPLVLLAYGVTGADRLVDLFQPAVLTGLATLMLLFAQSRTLRSERSGFAEAMVMTAVGFAGAYFVQAKGWSYQAVPLGGCAAIALAAVLTAEPKSRAIVLAAPALLCLPFWIAAEQAMREPPSASDLQRAVRGLSSGDSVGFIATEPALAWTVTLQRGFHYPSRYYGFWMMRAIVNNEGAARPNPRLTQLGKDVVEQTMQDFRCDPPRRIIVQRPTRADQFEILAFFLRDPQFAQMLSHYRPIQQSSLEVFDRSSPLAAGHDCARRARD